MNPEAFYQSQLANPYRRDLLAEPIWHADYMGDYHADHRAWRERLRQAQADPEVAARMEART